MDRISADAKIIIWISLIIVIGIQTVNALDAPWITPHEPDVTLEVGSNFKLECESSVPISWQVLESLPDVQYIVTHTIESSYKSILELLDVNYKYVGAFYCINNDSMVKDSSIIELDNLISESKASSIYVFVNDSVNLLANVFPHVIGNQNSTVIIPCKPTSKSVQVQLIIDGKELHQNESNFSSTTGYTVTLLDHRSYICQTTNNIIEFEVHVNPYNDYVQMPQITSMTGKYGTQGEQLVLNCSVEIELGVSIDIEWLLPNDITKHENRVQLLDITREVHTTGDVIYRRTIVINNLDATKDQGRYTCIVSDSFSHQNNRSIDIKILEKNESSLTLNEPSGKYTIIISSKESSAKWRVEYSGHPIPTLIWYDNEDKLIENSSKYEINKEKDHIILKIKHLELKDTGNYTLNAHNGIDGIEKKFQLIITDKPSVSVEDVNVLVGESATVICKCVGYPPSTISWTFKPCKFTQSSCDNEKSINIPISENVNTTPNSSLAQISELKFIPPEPGKVTCTANNIEGNDSGSAYIRIQDLEESFMVWRNGNLPTVSGDALSIYCGAAAYDFLGELNWYFNNTLVENSDNIIVRDFNHTYSYVKEITWSNIERFDSGVYECRAIMIKNNSLESNFINVDVNDPEKPKIVWTNLEDSITLELGEPITLQCEFSGMPIPEITWHKDGIHIITYDNDTRIGLYQNNTKLDIKFIKLEDASEYKCEGTNKFGSSNKQTSLKISNKPTLNKGWIYGIATLILILIICTIYLYIRVKRTRELLREMKAAGLANFEEGSPDSINPELALDEQADLLPYDKKYEFPKEKLKLGKQLGAGAFGVVIKAVAQGILLYEDETVVAVKMVKKTADNEVMRALVLELKIMVHLGQHLNVVNLLGAVTKNIIKREVMVIVEYCRFGNVQNFLIKHREYFIDQINPETDKIDPTILTKEQRWSNDSGYEYNSQGLKYVKLSFSNNHLNSNKSDGKKQASQLNSKCATRQSEVADYFTGGMDSSNTESALIKRRSEGAAEGEYNLVLSNNSVQPAWRSNYKMDYKGPIKNITTTDLVCWSFQVARGMEYLANRKVLHGDLAARNILLCDDNVVKICDFGLARSIYRSDNYKKKGEAPLPFKWLAIESIGDQIFSTYSDVWSFGIVLWELFSLGKVPYPGMDADQGLYFKLKDGYRMEKPNNATQEIYDIMLHCWNANPESRPLFGTLEKRLGNLLENGVAEHYIDLNDPYLQINIDQHKQGQTDYLSIVAPPDGIAPPIPNYVNSQIHSNSDVPDYLLMNPKTETAIFSPRACTNGENFQYPAGNVSDIFNNLKTNSSPKMHNKQKTDLPEEIPMLKSSYRHTNSDSDTETSANPSSNNQFLALRPQPTNRNIVNTTSDDYVNFPSTIINMKNIGNDAVSNPSYVSINQTRT